MRTAPAPRREDEEFFRAIESHRAHAFMRVMRLLPSEPRCVICRAPFAGAGAHVVRHFGFAPSRKNPRLCAACFEQAPAGGIEMDVGVLFADVRGFTALAERIEPRAATDLLNRFYDVAVEVLCRHAIIDKLVGDQVMALYLPQLLGDGAVEHMVDDARELVAGAPAALDIGIGMDFGRAFVGNVGSGDVKDFTAIGDVVNTAARLQAAAASDEVLISRRVCDVSPGELAGAEPRVLHLKGKSDDEDVLVLPVPRRAGVQG